MTNNYLQCGVCGTGIKGNNCNCKALSLKQGIYVYDPFRNVRTKPKVEPDKQSSLSSWEQIYVEELNKKNYLSSQKSYLKHYFQDTYDQLNQAHRIKGSVYLEIGCGPFYLGSAIARECQVVIGVDNSKSALLIAKQILTHKKIKNFLLIQTDLFDMPLCNGVIDLIYGGGVIEHFNRTDACLTELYRVLKPGGVSFNTVPFLNLGSLTYRQIWGNIPNFPILKQLAIFIHTRVLGGRHMIFGYEMSFPKYKLIQLHKAAGFRKTQVDKFRVNLAFAFLPGILKRLAEYLATTSPWFWPMVKAVAIK